MKENDFLKQFIQNHRADFDEEDLPPQLFPKMIAKLGKRKSAKKRTIIYTAVAAACVVFVLVSFFLLQNQKPTKEFNHISLSTNVEKKAETTNSDKPIQKPLSESTPSKQPEITVPPKMISHFAEKPINPDLYQNIIRELMSSNSVAWRVNAILEIGQLEIINKKLKDALCKTFSNDDNSNVRLAALNVLANYAQDSTTKKYLLNGMADEKDPVIQLELVRIMSADSDAAITKKLLQMADAPFTLPEVKDQVEYALLTRK